MQFAELLTKVGYLPPSDVDVLSRAYDAAASAHHDQNRLSGEKFIEQDKWDDAILRDIPSELTAEEKKRFDQMGKISVDEEIDFHFELEHPEALKKLAQLFE